MTAVAPPTPDLRGLAGSDRIARQLLDYATTLTVPLSRHQWARVLAHVPEGCTDVVDNLHALIDHIDRSRSLDLVDPVEYQLGILDNLWRLRHADWPCLSCVAAAASLDDVTRGDPLLCSRHRHGDDLAVEDRYRHCHRWDITPAMVRHDPRWTASPHGNDFYRELVDAYGQAVAHTLWEVAAEAVEVSP